MSADPARKARLSGRTNAVQMLFAAEAPQTGIGDHATAFAAGMADGIRDWLIAHVGERAAYAVLQAAADRTGEALVRAEAAAVPGAPGAEPPREEA